MTGARAARLTLALAAVLVLAAASAASAATCTCTTSPPPPPDRGAVLWSNTGQPCDPSFFNPTTLILNFGESVAEGDCNPPVTNPWSISVAPGAALVFQGLDENTRQTDLVSPWGALNVTQNGAIDPSAGAEFWAFTMSVAVVDAASVLSNYGSCRQCVISNTNVVLPGNPGNVVAFVNDLTGAKLLNVNVSGTGDLYRFSGTDLSGSSFQGASLVEATFSKVTVTGTSFGGADLRGTTFDSLQFSTQGISTPWVVDFTGATLGGDGMTCTSFTNTNLINANFNTLGGSPGALAPCSRVARSR